MIKTYHPVEQLEWCLAGLACHSAPTLPQGKCRPPQIRPCRNYRIWIILSHSILFRLQIRDLRPTYIVHIEIDTFWIWFLCNRLLGCCACCAYSNAPGSFIWTPDLLQFFRLPDYHCSKKHRPWESPTLKGTYIVLQLAGPGRVYVSWREGKHPFSSPFSILFLVWSFWPISMISAWCALARRAGRPAKWAKAGG